MASRYELSDVQLSESEIGFRADRFDDRAGAPMSGYSSEDAPLGRSREGLFTKIRLLADPSRSGSEFPPHRRQHGEYAPAAELLGAGRP